MSLKHALLRYNTFTLLHQTLIKKNFNKKSCRNSPKNKQKNLPWKLWNLKTCLNWRTWGVKNKNVKKMKGLLALGDIKFFFWNKSVKKNFYTCPHAWLLSHSLSCKHELLRHNVFTLLLQTLSQKSFLKKQTIPKFPQKQTKSPPLETLKPKYMLQMTHVRSKKQKCQVK